MRATTEQEVCTLDGRRLRPRSRGPRAVAGAAGALAAVLAATVLAACGSAASSAGASSNPRALLRQTFSSSHTVKSGVLHVALVITPTGSSLISAPVSLTLSGPFQSRGPGQAPESDLTVTFDGLGRHATFGVISTAAGAYMRISGVTYRLPASTVATLRSSLGASGSGPSLQGLGIDPEHWLAQPTIVGRETVDGASTEHLRAGVDVAALLSDLDRLLAKESAATAKAGLPTSISPATARRIAAAVRAPTVDIWTGRHDATLRRLALAATIPVTGTTSTRLGGLTSVALRFTLDYAQLNRSQTIATPTAVHGYAALRTRLAGLAAQLQGSLGAGAGSSAAPAGGSAGGTASGSAAQLPRYTRCLDRAAGDVARMQRCRALLPTTAR